MASPRRSRHEWKEIITSYRSSGLTTPQFAKEEGLNVHTLRYWLNTLNLAKELSQKPERFVELKWTEQTTAPIMVVLPNGIQIHIQSDASCEQVYNLTQSLL